MVTQSLPGRGSTTHVCHIQGQLGGRKHPTLQGVHAPPLQRACSHETDWHGEGQCATGQTFHCRPSHHACRQCGISWELSIGLWQLVCHKPWKLLASGRSGRHSHGYSPVYMASGLSYTPAANRCNKRIRLASGVT